MLPIIGAACLLQAGDAWFFELQKQHKWRHGTNGTPVIGVGCIGGRLERDETPQQALQREAREEIGCRVEIRRPGRRVFVGPDLSFRLMAPGEGDPLAALYWEAAEPGFIPGAKVAVYVGSSLGEPRPNDLPAVICVPTPAWPMLWSGGSVREFFRAGCRLLERVPIPGNARLEPVGTVAVLGQLRQASPELVEGLLDAGGNE